MAVHFLSRMDYSTALFTNLSPVLEATNTFSLQADGSAGALDVDGVRAALEGLGLAHNGAEVLDQPIAPFLGKGTISSVGYQILTGVAAEKELVLAGNPDFTNDVVVAFTVTAIDEDTLQQISESEITVAGQGITNGVAWQSYSEHSSNVVALNITGHANWKADLNQTPYRLTMEGAGFAYVDMDTNSSTYQTVVSYESQPFQFPSTNVYKTLIGQKMLFTANVPPAGSGMDVTNPLWTIGGDTVSNFVYGEFEIQDTNGITVTQHVGKAVFDFPKTNLSASFAWWKTGLVNVKFSCNINNKAASVQCKVEVIKPTGYIYPWPDGEDGISVGKVYLSDDGSSGRLGLGKALADDEGAYFDVRGTPTLSGFGWVPIITSSTRTLYRDQAEFTNSAGAVLIRTNRVFTAAGLDREAFLPANGPYDDNPKFTVESLPASGNLGASVNDQFTLYLMYRPGDNEVWVPLQSVSWGWKAALTNSPTVWVPNTSWTNSPLVSPVIANPQYPSWTNRVVPVGTP